MTRQRCVVAAAAIVATLAASAALGACGGGDDGSATATERGTATTTAVAGGGETGAPATTAKAGSGTPAAAGKKATIDACALLTKAEAEAVLGEAVVRSGPTGGVGESICEWVTATESSVTVSVGSPGTAAGNDFDPKADSAGFADPEPVASLKGAYFYGFGLVEFPAAERRNGVQVVAAVAGGADRSAAEKLAATLADRITKAG